MKEGGNYNAINLPQLGTSSIGSSWGYVYLCIITTHVNTEVM